MGDFSGWVSGWGVDFRSNDEMSALVVRLGNELTIEPWRGTSMDKTKLVLGLVFVFILGGPKWALGQAAAEAGLVHGLSAGTTASAASHLSAATNRALQGQAAAASKATQPATTTAVHRTRTASSTTSTASTTSGRSKAATTNNQGAKLPSGVVHVWPEGALTQGSGSGSAPGSGEPQ